jgi:hypothetical protein
VRALALIRRIRTTLLPTNFLPFQRLFPAIFLTSIFFSGMVSVQYRRRIKNLLTNKGSRIDSERGSGREINRKNYGLNKCWICFSRLYFNKQMREKVGCGVGPFKTNFIYTIGADMQTFYESTPYVSISGNFWGGGG